MSYPIQKALKNFFPFILIGTCFAFFIGLFVILSYFILWGFIIGVIFWLGVSIKEYFFPSHTFMKRKRRIIEYKDQDL